MAAKHLFPLLLAILLLGACTRGERNEADRKAEEARAKAHELAHDARRQAADVTSQIKTDSSGAAGRKLRQGERRVEEAGDEAAVKLDRAARLAKVKARLAGDLGAETLSEVSVDVSGSVVTLTGSVKSDDQKKAAERAALSVDGVTKVNNELTVNPAG